MSKSSRAALEIAEALRLTGACGSACCGETDTCSGCDCCRLHCDCDYDYDYTDKEETDDQLQD